jgi:tail protein
MLTLVEVRGQGGMLSLPLEDSALGYDIQDIQGLDPVKATLVSSSFAQQDGAQYQSARREARNIRLVLGLYPDYASDSVRSLRQRLYPFFMPKTAVSLRFFMADGLTVDIDGRVETFESTMFTEEPGVEISLLCFDPDFIDPEPVEIEGATTSGSSTVSVNYEGTVETGIELILDVNRTLGEFTIYHQLPDGSIKTMDFQAPLLTGDTVTINTVSGNKSAVLTRASVDSSILYGISPQSNWLELDTGSNAIRVYAEGAAVPYTINYIRRYGGL